MLQVERHYHKGNPEIIKLCQTSKELYNHCTYAMRQAFFTKQRVPDINILATLTQDLDCFKELHNTKTAKQTIRKVLSDWSNFFKSLKAYKKDSSKFISCPRPPNYKEKLAQVIFYNETIRKKPLKEGIITPTNDLFKINSNKPFKQVVITPKAFGFIIEVQYDNKTTNTLPKPKLDKTKHLNIDIGVNNLCAITYDQNPPILVNGRIVKSINQWHNKRPKSKKRLRKRYFRLENYFHHTSKFIIDLCIKHNIGHIIIGKNDGWKQNINIGKKNNQTCCYIPIYLLLEKIKYKAAIVGINVTFTEEAYTSKASFFDNDSLPKYGDEVPEFSGNRKNRGLYITKDNFAVNADVNGSLNIGRKVIPEFLGIGDRSLAARPIVINPLRKLDGEGQVVNCLNS